MKILHLDTVDSTSTLAKRLCLEQPDGQEILLITAREQTAGRGRTGKSFSSLRDNGLYMTVAFPVSEKPQQCLFLTIAAAVAVLEVLAENGCKGLGIKWVNDLYRGQRKICGILTETVTDPDSGLMRHAVIGVGINLDTDLSRLPEELQKKAGTISLGPVSREQLSVLLAERIVNLALSCLGKEETRQATMMKYRRYSILPGKTVSWEEGGVTLEGTAEGIDEEGHLLVRTAQGLSCLDSGYVSVIFSAN